MIHELHALEIIREKCDGKLACLRVCPTDAVRVREGKVQINPFKCISCGECIVVCEEGAILARADTWDSVKSFPFKVAVPSPTLFGQFPADVTPADVVEGLKAIGFDEVYDPSIESELINKATGDFLDEYKGPLPVISISCPVVVRLIQVSFPGMADQLLPIEPPRELAGREMKRYYVEEKGIPKEDIGAIYITPCPAKMASIKQPAEKVKSHLDLAIGINELYNPLLLAITKLQRDRKGQRDISNQQAIKSKVYLGHALTGEQSRALKRGRFLTVARLPNIIRIFEDLEKGKLREVGFLDCYACTSGCIGGPLVIDDRFVARSKIQKHINAIEQSGINLDDEINKRYVKGDYFLRQRIGPRTLKFRNLSIREQIERVKIKEKLNDVLPGVDCCMCGAPSCEVFAEDVSNQEAVSSDCIFISNDRLDSLRETYKFNDSEIPKIEAETE